MNSDQFTATVPKFHWDLRLRTLDLGLKTLDLGRQLWLLGRGGAKEETLPSVATWQCKKTRGSHFYGSDGLNAIKIGTYMGLRQTPANLDLRNGQGSQYDREPAR